MIEIGQVLSLKIRFNNSGAVASVAHPILVLKVDKEKNILEVAHIDSITKEKKWKALLKSNVTIKKSNPEETVIDKDSFVQIDNIIQLENFSKLETKRRQIDKLSNEKFNKVLSLDIPFMHFFPHIKHFPFSINWQYDILCVSE